MLGHGTFGSLTFRGIGDNVTPVRSPLWLVNDCCIQGVALMKVLHVCFAALGFAVARWFFKREPLAVADPVARLRASGLL